MKRNQFGINLDEGAALYSNEDFALLHVDVHNEANERLAQWLDRADGSACLGGQIGCGKTTLINHILLAKKNCADPVFYFDKNINDLSWVDNWLIVFTELLDKLVQLQLVDDIPDIFTSVLGKSAAEISKAISQIQLKFVDQQAFAKKQQFISLLEQADSSLPHLLKDLINKIEHKIGRPATIIAAGVDKFEMDSAAYFSLRQILLYLKQFKTLFEINAVHFFSDKQLCNDIDKIFIASIPDDGIKQILQKRLGKYASVYTNEIGFISAYSAGMPRQAIRLLDCFISLEKKKKNKVVSLQQSLMSLNRDYFAFADRPSDALLNNIEKNKFIEAALISLPGDKETAARAVFGNWVIIRQHDRDAKWKTIINPLVRQSVLKNLPAEPEMRLLKEYALQAGISNFGLEMNINSKLAKCFLLTEIEKRPELNLTEIMDILGSALLSKDRADRTVIAFHDEQVANVVSAYLQARSNSYEYQLWQHSAISATSEKSPLLQIIDRVVNNQSDIYSFKFPANLDDKALIGLNIKRDFFADKQMIWWIPVSALNKYLKKWVQLRQLFRILILEENIGNSLSVEELQADIDYMQELTDAGIGQDESVKNLRIVIDYLVRSDEHG